jgi:hypothetical protein
MCVGIVSAGEQGGLTILLRITGPGREAVGLLISAAAERYILAAELHI